MPPGFRTLAEPPKNTLEAVLRVVGVGILTAGFWFLVDENGLGKCIDESQKYAVKCEEKLKAGVYDDEVKRYLSRDVHRFSGLNPHFLRDKFESWRK